MLTPTERDTIRARLDLNVSNHVGPRWMREALARLLDDLDQRDRLDTAPDAEGTGKGGGA